MTEFVMRRGNGPESPIVARGCVFSNGRTVLVPEDEDYHVTTYVSPEEFLTKCGKDAQTFVLKADKEDLEMMLEPFHADAFNGTPAEGAFKKTRSRKAQWVAIDSWGNPIGIGPLVVKDV